MYRKLRIRYPLSWRTRTRFIHYCKEFFIIYNILYYYNGCQHLLVSAFSHVDNAAISVGDNFETWHLSEIASTHSNLNFRVNR